ncbi:MAG: Nif3-like dinuclear metal center hexameric protein [Rhodocyclaceae bacterium]|nr:Nif3-like dinuclear metal center hexameric protein [Rhodocyclaceae bacterium]MBX3669306.1 Nif3-like dinuclear metal center hexameric protein [Rhodocyclaceae bacterium]
MRRSELQQYLDKLLENMRFKDYCPNGLQVEGRAEIRRVVCGVTACQALVDAAIALDADAILVHHGWFWRGEDGRVTGTRKQRLASILAHDINLFAYHLPLDAHPELGNNAQLALRLGWKADARFGEQDLGCAGQPERALSAAELAAEVGRRLLREPLLVGDGERQVRRVAWCTGAAQNMFEAAIAAGADLYLSGEISEPTVHLARESGVPYIAAGHHATERYGVQALGSHLARSLGLEARFVDIDNPV